MNDPKTTVYNALKNITARVYQVRPEVIAEFPTITFYVESNIPEYALDSELMHQNYRVTVDIWGKTSTETKTLQSSIELAMRNIKYICIGSVDVPETEGFSHIAITFEY